MKNEKLKELRKQKGLSQQELADLVGIPRRAVNIMENGMLGDSCLSPFQPSFDTMCKVVLSLGCEDFSEVFSVPKEDYRAFIKSVEEKKRGFEKKVEKRY